MRWARCTTSCTPRSWSPTTMCTQAASTSRTAVSRMRRTLSRSRATRWQSFALDMWIGSRRSTAAGPSPRVRQLANLRVLWAGSALAALLVVGLLIALPRLQPSMGTLLVLAAARSPESLPSTTVSLHGSAGWTAVGSVSGSVPAAPEQRELLALPVAVGTYEGVRLGAEEQSVAISLVAGRVRPCRPGRTCFQQQRDRWQGCRDRGFPHDMPSDLPALYSAFRAARKAKAAVKRAACRGDDRSSNGYPIGARQLREEHQCVVDLRHRNT